MGGKRGVVKRRAIIGITVPILQMDKMRLRLRHMVNTWTWGLNLKFLVQTLASTIEHVEYEVVFVQIAQWNVRPLATSPRVSQGS